MTAGASELDTLNLLVTASEPLQVASEYYTQDDPSLVGAVASPRSDRVPDGSSAAPAAAAGLSAAARHHPAPASRVLSRGRRPRAGGPAAAMTFSSNLDSEPRAAAAGTHCRAGRFRVAVKKPRNSECASWGDAH